MRKGVLCTVLAGALLWGCGGGIVDGTGGGSSGGGGGSGGGGTSYYITINSFSVTPTSVNVNESFTVSASFEFSSITGVSYWTLKASDQASTYTLLQFYCGSSIYNCVNSFTVTCTWYSGQIGTYLRCTDPIGNWKDVLLDPGSYTLTAEGCAGSLTGEICDQASGVVTLQ